MTEQKATIGDTVTATYKTGKYIAELIEWGSDRALVKITAVLRHPTQGDLHFPGSVDVAFQQRRALALNEKTWVHPASVKKYENDVPSYEESLHEAIAAEVGKLVEKGDPWAKRSIEMLEDLKHDYFKS